MQQNDETHLALANRFIDQFNEATLAGYSAPFIASAAVAAAAAYSAFAHRRARVPLTDQQLDTVAGHFRQRMVEFSQQGAARDARGTDTGNERTP